ncbi:DNA topoisomerase III [Vallitalea okinawensis]|uniref:DNA topoisomerase III n=1 Tax=Vallitalea okinawensis TaxID=2078660 RepID=UPI000CFCDA13|nr:DNA topoisomerase III [Vallitalea okinawensis]
MVKKLVLAEKPSVGREIARVLKCTKKGNGFIEGNQYIVTWALGHLVTLADPEAYNKQYASWRMEDLPMLPDRLKLIVIKKTRKQYESVKSQLFRKDVNEVIIATDAGREGELVARWILDKSGCKKPIKRLWISSVTDKAIKDGFNSLKDGRQYNNLYHSAVARAEADWFVGINATRALTCKYNAQLSCGRVQTPTLAMVASREEEIKNFQPKSYYGLKAYTKGVGFAWQDQKNKSSRSFNKERIDGLYKSLSNSKDAKVVDVKKATKKSFAPRLYDLTDLQRDANRLFSFSAKETLSIMQRLYESHKVLTYPRTDSRYLTDDMVDSLKDRVRACCVGPYRTAAAPLLKTTIRGNKSFVDNKKVSDHHAIVPTEESVMLSKLSDKERKIYDLVVKRFIAVLYPPCEFDQMTVTMEMGKEIFVVKGKKITNQGWKKVYDIELDEENEEDDEQSLPEFKVGEKLAINQVKLTSGETKPPSPLNEGTLLAAMENPAKYMSGEKKDLVKVIGETGGIGTVATRADIIEKLFNNFLLEKKGKSIYITSKGKQLLELVPEELRSPALTAKWEQKLIAISKGQLQKKNFIDEMKGYTKVVIKEVKNSTETFKHDNVTMNRCPDCGKFMLEVNGKKGKMLVCQDRECGYRKPISKLTNARCPNCHKKLELKGEGEGQIFVCVCGYREKMKNFKERKNKQNDSGNKRDVNKYLKNQKKKDDEPFNSAFGDAFSNLKL